MRTIDLHNTGGALHVERTATTTLVIAPRLLSVPSVHNGCHLSRDSSLKQILTHFNSLGEIQIQAVHQLLLEPFQLMHQVRHRFVSIHGLTDVGEVVLGELRLVYSLVAIRIAALNHLLPETFPVLFPEDADE
mmetsp:Transcript_53977/g.148900  ORF Transcript_53977/g.148900 Transcript_53977/m.148900 type:complete len:133 (-) Transcript_53977:491-889(-)